MNGSEYHIDHNNENTDSERHVFMLKGGYGDEAFYDDKLSPIKEVSVYLINC